MAQTTYTTMFVWTVLTFFDQFDRKKKERKKKERKKEERKFSSTRVAGASVPQQKSHKCKYDRKLPCVVIGHACKSAQKVMRPDIDGATPCPLTLATRVLIEW